MQQQRLRVIPSENTFARLVVNRSFDRLCASRGIGWRCSNLV